MSRRVLGWILRGKATLLLWCMAAAQISTSPVCGLLNPSKDHEADQ